MFGKGKKDFDNIMITNGDEEREDLIEYPCGLKSRRERYHKSTCVVCKNLDKSSKISKSFVSPNTKERFRKKFRS